MGADKGQIILVSLIALLVVITLSAFDFGGITFQAIKEYDMVDVPSVEEGTEMRFQKFKYSNYRDVFTLTEAEVNCKWKDPEKDDGYKICEAIFEINDKRGINSLIESPEVVLEFAKPGEVKNVDILYSTKFKVEEEEYQEQIIKEKGKRKNYKGTITGKVILEEEDSKEVRRVGKGISRNKKEKSEEEKEIGLEKGKIFKRQFDSFFELPTLEEIEKREKEKEEYFESDARDTLLGNNDEVEEKEIKDSLKGNESNESVEEITLENETENQTLEKETNDSEIEEGVNQTIEEWEEKDSGAVENLTTTEEGEEISEIIIDSEESVGTEEPEEVNEDTETGEPKVTGNSILTGWVSKTFGESEINTEEPFAVLVRFEIPKYEDNAFNFTIMDNNFEAKIDPIISSCGVLSNPGTIYNMTQSIYTSGGCFEIIGDNITLNCEGNMISYGESIGGGYGIYVNSSGVEIRDCVIRNSNSSITLGAGVYLDSADDFYMIDTTVQINGDHVSGIRSFESTNSLLSAIDIYTYGDNSYGALIEGDSEGFEIAESSFSSEGQNSNNIYLDNASGVILGENEIISEGYASHAIYSQSSANNDFSLNYLEVYGYYAFGIYLDQTQNTEISGNEIYIYGEGGNSIYLEDSTRQLISSNSLIVEGIYSSGYYSKEKSTNNSFIGNNITSIGDDRYGIMLESDLGNYYSLNEIKTTGDYGYGILVWNSSNNLFEDTIVEIYGENSNCVFMDYPSNNNTFDGMNLWSNNSEAATFYSWYRSGNYTLKNSLLNASHENSTELYFDAIMTNDVPGYRNFTNLSYETEYWHESATGEISYYWYVDLEVNSTEGVGVNNASIDYESSGGRIYTDSTNAQGTLSNKELLMFTQNGSNNIYYDNYYNLSVEKGESSNFTEFNLTDNKVIFMTLLLEDEEIEETEEEASQSSSGGGGGGSTICEAQWKCTNWDECMDSEQTRTCVNKKPGCVGEMPTTTKFCVDDKIKIRKTLFDINLELLNEKLSSTAEKLLSRIFLLNIGVPGKVNTTVYYEIKNKKGDIIYVETENIIVETQTEYLKEIDISKFGDGEYSIETILSYEGQTEPASSFSKFQIGEVERKIPIHYYIIFAIIVGIIILVILILKTFKEDKKNRGSKEKEMEAAIQKVKGKIPSELDDKTLVSLYNEIKSKYDSLEDSKKKEYYKRIMDAFHVGI